jgi:phosphotransferase system HPr (HPr) family protein
MESAEIVVENRSGLHARPGKVFSQRAARWASTVRVENLTRATGPADAKSILGLLALGVSRGDRIRVTTDGADEGPALADLLGLIRNGLDGPAEADPS